MSFYKVILILAAKLTIILHLNTKQQKKSRKTFRYRIFNVPLRTDKEDHYTICYPK